MDGIPEPRESVQRLVGLTLKLGRASVQARNRSCRFAHPNPRELIRQARVGAHLGWSGRSINRDLLAGLHRREGPFDVREAVDQRFVAGIAGPMRPFGLNLTNALSHRRPGVDPLVQLKQGVANVIATEVGPESRVHTLVFRREALVIEQRTIAGDLLVGSPQVLRDAGGERDVGLQLRQRIERFLAIQVGELVNREAGRQAERFGPERAREGLVQEVFVYPLLAERIVEYVQDLIDRTENPGALQSPPHPAESVADRVSRYVGTEEGYDVVATRQPVDEAMIRERLPADKDDPHALLLSAVFRASASHEAGVSMSAS